MKHLLRLALALCAGSCLAYDGPVLSGFQNRTGAAVAVPGDVIDVLGSNLADDGIAPASAWPIPMIAGTTTVTCGGFPAPILVAASDHIRIQLPWELAGLASTNIVVTRNGMASAPLQVSLSEFAPAVLSAVTNGQTIVLSAAGLGPRVSNPPAGVEPTATYPGAVEARFFITLGGVATPITKTVLADTGDVQSDAGVESITILVPANAPAGAGVPLVIAIGGLQSDPFPVAISPSGVQITLSPASVQVPLNGSVKFQTSVQGSSDTALVWSIDPLAYSLPNSVTNPGSLTQQGVFSGNYTMPVPDQAIIRATHSSGAFATALVQLVAMDKNLYRISPDSPVISPGESVTFTLLGPDGSPVSGASWNISDGFSGSGGNTYTAPLATYDAPQVNVYASLPGTNGFSYNVATTTVFVDPPRVQITGSSPSVGHIGENLTITSSGVQARVARLWFTMADGSRSAVTGVTSTSGATVTVPHGAVSGPAALELSSGSGSSFLSAPFPLTILPRLRLHAARLHVSSGETIPITAAAPDIPGPWQFTWRADFGSVDANGQFTAPAVSQPTFARIWACLLQNTECGTVIVEVLPFRIDPDPLILNPGESLPLTAWQGSGPVTAQWQALTPNVTVAPDGTLTAGMGAFDGGQAKVSATYGGVTQTFSISIKAPGAIANTLEYYDWLGYDNNSPYGRLELGAFASHVVSNGDWVYALSRSFEFGNYGGPWLSTWLDVYHLDARRNPVWVDAVEAPYIYAIDQSTLSMDGNTLYAIGQEGQNNAVNNILVSFDITNGRPVLLSHQIFDGSATAYHHQGVGATLNPAGYANPGQNITLDITDYTTGTTTQLPIDFQPLYSTYTSTAVGAPGWAAVTFNYPFSGTGASYETVIFDTTGAKAEPIGDVPSGGFDYTLTVLQDLLVVGGDIYQIAGGSVNYMSTIPLTWVLTSDPATKRLVGIPGFLNQREGYRVADLTDAAHPILSAPVTLPSQYVLSGGLGSDYLALPNPVQNVGIYPIVWPAAQTTPTPPVGPALLDTFPASPSMYAMRFRGNYLYWTGAGFGFAGRGLSRDIFEVDDITSAPFRAVSTNDRPGDETGYAIELNGNYAYVGTDAELLVYDLSVPSRPVFVTSVALPSISLAISGNYLYAGAVDGKLAALVVFDVSNPASPREIGSTALPGLAYGVTVQPGWLAVAMGAQGMNIYSLVSPAAPVQIYQVGLPTWDVAGAGNLLYSASDATGLAIWNMATPANPLIVSTTPIDGPAYTVSLDPRGIAWLCSGTNGVVDGLDIRQPSSPREVTEIVTGAGLYSESAAAVWNSQLFVAGVNLALDVTAPVNVGISQVDQTYPGEVQPDRVNDQAPVAQTKPASGESPKAKALRLRFR